jgi:transposase InsO family protein
MDFMMDRAGGRGCSGRLPLFGGLPESITVDNGAEFCSRAVDGWAYQHGVKLDFIRRGKPVENGYIESFNGKLRDEWLEHGVVFQRNGRSTKVGAMA